LNEKLPLTHAPLFELDSHYREIVVPYSASHSLLVKEFAQFVVGSRKETILGGEVVILKTF
jgi:hypothetical protein